MRPCAKILVVIFIPHRRQGFLHLTPHPLVTLFRIRVIFLITLLRRKCAACHVYLRSRRIRVGDIWRRVNYVVYVWTGRMCWGVGVRYIYLISIILNVYRGDMIYDICFNTLTHIVTLLCLTIKILVICVVLVRSLR